MSRLAAGHHSQAAEELAALAGPTRRLGGSDAQREILEETRIAALVRAGRLDEARVVLDERLDRRPSPRDQRWREDCLVSGEADLVARHSDLHLAQG